MEIALAINTLLSMISLCFKVLQVNRKCSKFKSKPYEGVVAQLHHLCVFTAQGDFLGRKHLVFLSF